MPAPIEVEDAAELAARLRDGPRRLLASIPLVLMQPVLDRIATHVARSRPEMFARLGPHAGKRFLIDPIDLPFVFMLVPTAVRPHLSASWRGESPQHDAAIAGVFLDLFDMISGTSDGDALFFTRDLRVSGDTEAVVALRNALDDFGGSAADTVLGAFGPLSGAAALAIASLRAMRGSHRHGR